MLIARLPDVAVQQNLPVPVRGAPQSRFHFSTKWNYRARAAPPMGGKPASRRKGGATRPHMDQSWCARATGHRPQSLPSPKQPLRQPSPSLLLPLPTGCALVCTSIDPPVHRQEPSGRPGSPSQRSSQTREKKVSVPSSPFDQCDPVCQSSRRCREIPVGSLSPCLPWPVRVRASFPSRTSFFFSFAPFPFNL